MQKLVLVSLDDKFDPKLSDFNARTLLETMPRQLVPKRWGVQHAAYSAPAACAREGFNTSRSTGLTLKR